uniref:DoxX family protein n=1 Tax=Strombidium rassoulzadegani TaxID=1082188 RepID=A0A7S3FRI3_9SPIT|mmetsp:Transcript_11062/g.18503  ORF Transcript_11062/g.18503 Transcript_11062/m.18503 type:complete len:174 (+) Transcript_11062:31-552(+)|eukprot:CAMPEP_0168614390 /NCGR_PEP_ID=MMETSP0449_2-20121227/3949_1 /TAXON_ID=1082188 /ORGANISM="Strombidium rassoulzadegani, Strain ras09" /LENGTH=173 /DNA_ID=CAMNT_0008655067 /DNA_START=18 /DNA_END=539 /DNA_ORIENTATION=+
MPPKHLQPTSYTNIAVYILRVALIFTLLGFGYLMITEHGERNYNMYLHSLRKMYLPKSKPGDASPLGMSWNDLNMSMITLEGGLFVAAGVLLMVQADLLSGLVLVVASAFLMVSKDNVWIKSDVSAITRENNLRLERFCRDVSVIGVGVMLIGGYFMPEKHKIKTAASQEDSE